MDPAQFDELIRRISTGLSRRSMMIGGLGSSLATAVGLAATDDNEALAKRNRQKDRRDKGGKGKGNNGKGGKNKGGASVERKKGKGGKCRKNKNCLSNNCQGGRDQKRKGNGRCQPSDVGQRCENDSDCIAGSPCIDGICNFAS